MFCARKGCGTENNVTFDYPLCYKHWLEFDSYELFECSECHYFEAEGKGNEIIAGEDEHDSDGFDWICWDCRDQILLAEPINDVHQHADIAVWSRFLYILEIDGKGAREFYIGQTYDLESRLAEHKQGRTASTKNKNPELVFFLEFDGDKKQVLEEEANLTVMNSTESGRREILRMVLDWQRPLSKVKFLI